MPEAAESSNTNPAGRASQRTERFWLGLAVLVTLLMYWGVQDFQFVFDDKPLILDNPRIQYSRFIPSYFTEHFFTHMDAVSKGNYYRPVQLLWFRMCFWMFGPVAAGWHWATLLLHLTMVALVFRLGRALGGNASFAGIAALFFGLHPVHVEVAAWASGVSELLVAVPMMASAIFFLRFRKSGDRVEALLAAIFCGVALLAKESAIVLPGLLFATDWILTRAEHAHGRSWRKQIRTSLLRVLPLLGMAAIYLVVRAIALGGLMHAVTPVSFGTMVMTWPSVLAFYMRLLLWPAGLSAFYDTPYVTSFSVNQVVLPLGIVMVAAVGLGWLARRNAMAAVAAVWLTLPLLPLLNFTVFPPEEIAHDRYLYLPSIGFCLLLGWGVCRWVRGGSSVFGLPLLRLLAVFLIAAGYAGVTAMQKNFWEENLTLYRRGVQVAPNNNLVGNNLANELLARGQRKEAIAQYEKVLARNPDYFFTQYNLGNAYYQQKEYDKAEPYLKKAMELNPLDADPAARLSQIRLRQGNLSEAEALMRKAITLRPSAPGQRFALGLILESQQKFSEAKEAYQAEMEFDPWRDFARISLERLQKAAQPPAPASPPPAVPAKRP